MRHRTSIRLALVLLALGGCTTAPEPVSGVDDWKISGSWRVEDVDGKGVMDNANLLLDFDGAGRLSGSTGCNRVSGAYAQEGSTIHFTGLISTRRMCSPALMNQEQSLLASLAAASTMSRDQSGALTLKGAKPYQILMRSEPMPAQSVAAPPAQRMIITPTPDTYLCNGERYLMALEAGVAYVTLPGGELLQLPLMNPGDTADVASPRTFSNGRLTVFAGREPAATVRLAKGRMATEPCERQG